jgi:glycosyltransferase involved in cell wall biosynthesis
VSRTAVLEFVTDFRIGGTERQVANVVKGLVASDLEVHVGCFRHEGQFLADVEALGVPVVAFEIEALGRLATLRQQWRLAQYLKRERIALVHSFGFYPNLFAVPAARIAGVRSIASIRDTGDHLTPLRRAAQRHVCRLADLVVANAEAVGRRLVAEGFDRRRLRVVHNGIVAGLARPRGAVESLRAELGLPPASRLVTVMARFTTLKGIEYFLDAAASLARRFEDVRFLIVGDSVCIGRGSAAYRAALERRAARLGLAGRALFLGFRDDVADLLASTSISVLPSLSEGLSNVVLEAMAAGVPVVATDVGGNPEMVVDGETGFLVPPRNARALSTAIGRLLVDPLLARRLGAAGQRRAAAAFSFEAMVDKTRSLYGEVLDLAPAPSAHPSDIAKPATGRWHAVGGSR